MFLAVQMVAERLTFLNTRRCWGAEGRLTPSTEEGRVPRKDGYSGKVDNPCWHCTGRGRPGPQATTPKLPDRHGPEAKLIYRFPGPAVTDVANWGALDNGNLLSHSSGGQKFKIEVSAGAGPSWGPTWWRI